MTAVRMLNGVRWRRTFRTNRLRRGSRDWREYERGKRLLENLSPDEYEEAIRELRNWLGL